MLKPYSLNELRIGFVKIFNDTNRESILERNTYLYDSREISGIEISIELHGGKIVTLDATEVLDWEIELDDIYIDDEILD